MSNTAGPNLSKNRLLRASDLAAREQNVLSFIVHQVRKAPNGITAPFLVDADTILDSETESNCMALNLTNTRAIAAILGDETDNWKGCGLIFEVKQKTLSGSREKVWGFEFKAAVDAATAAKKRKTKPLPPEKLEEKSRPTTTRYDMVPF